MGLFPVRCFPLFAYPALKNYILPVLGDVKLKDLSKERQEKALRAINRTLRKQKSKSALCGYVRRAYKGLLISLCA